MLNRGVLGSGVRVAVVEDDPPSVVSQEKSRTSDVGLSVGESTEDVVIRVWTIQRVER